MSEQICGECRHHKAFMEELGLHQERYKHYFCDNEQSDYYTDFTDYTDTCDCFEQRGIE